MRQITRRTILAILVVVALLLALGAVPSFLQSGDPYYLTVSPTEDNHTAINISTLSADRYPYTTAALANATSTDGGRSHPYWKGPFGLKGAFTHSPFDERDALAQRNASAAEGEAIYVRQNNTVYRLTVGQ